VPELIRSAVSRARMYFRDRRRSPRLRARIGFSVSVLRQSKLRRLTGSDHTLKGHTRDLSANGLALLLPQIHLDGYHLAAEGREMNLMLEVTGEPIQMVIAAKRYEKLEGSELGCNYLIGARIVRIDETDRSRYQELISTALKNGSPKDESVVN